MGQLGLPDVDFPAPLPNNKQESINWIESGYKPTKKLQHENISELGIFEAQQYGEVEIIGYPGLQIRLTYLPKKTKMLHTMDQLEIKG